VVIEYRASSQSREIQLTVIGKSPVDIIPLLLLEDLCQPLGAAEGDLELVDTAIEAVLRTVEDLLGLEDGEDLALTLEDLLGEEDLAELSDVDFGGVTLRGEQLGALGARRLEGLDPVWYLRHGWVDVKGGGEEEKGRRGEGEQER
jgi:hypothetical protein